MFDDYNKFYIMGDCGHEIYEKEGQFPWEGKILCPDCFQEKFDELSIYEKADLLGSEWVPVERPVRKRVV